MNALVTTHASVAMSSAEAEYNAMAGTPYIGAFLIEDPPQYRSAAVQGALPTGHPEFVQGASCPRSICTLLSLARPSLARPRSPLAPSLAPRSPVPRPSLFPSLAPRSPSRSPLARRSLAPGMVEGSTCRMGMQSLSEEMSVESGV